MNEPKQKPKLTKPKMLKRLTKQPDRIPYKQKEPRAENDERKEAVDQVEEASINTSRAILSKPKSTVSKSRRNNTSLKSRQHKANTSPKTKTSYSSPNNTKGNSLVKSKTSLTSKPIKSKVKAKRKVNALRKASAISKRTAKKVVKRTRATVKSVITAAKAAVAAIKSIIAAISAGGWIVIIIILVLTLIIMLAASPWGIFFEDTDVSTPTISELVVELNHDFQQELNALISDAENVDEIQFSSEYDSDQITPNNWPDILGVFAVKLTANPDIDAYLDVLVLDEAKIDFLETVFWDMNHISYKIIETEKAVEQIEREDAPEPTPSIYRTMMITVDSLTYQQGAALYNFTEKQNRLLHELMGAEYYGMLREICGADTYAGLTPEQLENLINDLPVGSLGSEIVKHAASRLGDPYSQALRGQGNYVDCSYLSRWCYLQAGVSHFVAPTAASQAEYCVDNRLTIAKSALLPGDLVFWSFKANGRFMDITHVGIYANNGMVIDASYSNGMVVYRELFGADYQVLYARPHVR